MNIDYLDMIFSTCFTLRKMKQILIQEEKKEFSLRPQLHILIISPFGTFKSSITKELEKTRTKEIVLIDDFSRPGIEGSIGKDGDYVPPLLISLGGKVLIIDEWNSVDYYGQRSLLGLLENQRVNRSIGFKVKRPFKFKSKYGYYSIVDNRIQGAMLFSCIAYAMEYPIKENSQKDKALLSRYTPLFIEPNLEYMKEHTKGNFDLNLKDYSQDVNEVVIEKKCYLEFHDLYFNYLEAKELLPEDSNDYGFISRVMSDIIRLGVYNYLSKNPTEESKVIIKDVVYFKEMFVYVNTLLQQFMNPNTKGKITQYKTLLKKHPNKRKEFYYKTLGVSRQTLNEYDNKIGNTIK